MKLRIKSELVKPKTKFFVSSTISSSFNQKKQHLLRYYSNINIICKNTVLTLLNKHNLIIGFKFTNKNKELSKFIPRYNRKKYIS